MTDKWRVVLAIVLCLGAVVATNWFVSEDPQWRAALRDAAELDVSARPGNELNVWQVAYVGYGRGPVLVVEVRRADGAVKQLFVPEDGRFFDLYHRLVKGQYVTFRFIRGDVPSGRAVAASDYIVPDDSPFRHTRRYQVNR